MPLPAHIASHKVVCVSKLSPEAVTKDSAKKPPVCGADWDDVLSVITALTEEMALDLLGNQTLILKAQTQGHTFLPQPGLHKDYPKPKAEPGSPV